MSGSSWFYYKKHTHVGHDGHLTVDVLTRSSAGTVNDEGRTGNDRL